MSKSYYAYSIIDIGLFHTHTWGMPACRPTSVGSLPMVDPGVFQGLGSTPPVKLETFLHLFLEFVCFCPLPVVHCIPDMHVVQGNQGLFISCFVLIICFPINEVGLQRISCHRPKYNVLVFYVSGGQRNPIEATSATAFPLIIFSKSKN